MNIEKFLASSPIFASYLLYETLLRGTAKQLNEFDIGVIDALVLVAIGMEKQVVTPSLLIQSFHLKPSNLSQILKYLETRHWIKRSSSLQDLRKWELTITPEGKKIVNKLLKFFDLSQNHFENTIGISRLKLLRSITNELIQVFEKNRNYFEVIPNSFITN